MAFLSLLVLWNVLIFTRIAEPAPTYITEPSKPSFVDEGNNITLQWTYNVDGTFKDGNFLLLPSKTIAAIDSGGLFVDDAYQDRIFMVASASETTITLLAVNRSDSGNYQYRIRNTGFAVADSNVEISVRFPPSISGFFGNQTKNESDLANLICNATGDPEPTVTLRRLSDNTIVNSSFTITGKQDEGAYRCTADNGVGNAATADVFIIVQNYHPIKTQLLTNLTNNTVVVNEGIKLTCSAQANPSAKYRFYDSLSNNTVAGSSSVYTTSISEKINQVIYSCTPFNFYDDGPTRTVAVTVHCPAEIASAPTSQQAVEGNGATLFCNATCNPQPNITWTKQGNNSVLSSSETLTLTNLRRGDNGTGYICKVQNSLGSDEATTTITVLFPPDFITKPLPQEVVERHGATLFCNATGNPQPNITWTKQGNNTVLPSSETLTLTNLTREDNGTVYICKAQNNVGSQEATVTITVLFPPDFITKPLSQKVVESNGVTLFCNATGNPQPSITWTKQGNNTVLSSSETLPLTNLLRGDNGTVYICKVQNSLGSDEATATITVLFPPDLITKPLSQEVVESNGVTLFCNATGNPQPNITWTKQGSNTVFPSSETLPLTNLTREDNGTVYKCKVQNSLGSDEATATITVLFPPDLITKPLSQEVVESNGVTLFCNATGNPRPNITWTKQGSNTVFPSSETLTLTNLTREDNGAVYKCKAQNSLGSDEATATITVLYEPSVTIQRCSSPVTEGGNATLFCNATGNPLPSIAWIKASTGQVVSRNETHAIAAIPRSQSDSYTCLGWNGVGSNDTKPCTIVVNYPPVITKPQNRIQSINASESVTIECLAEANPAAQYVWKKATGEVASIDGYLRLNKVNDSDGGNYTCTATNRLGSDNITILVKVTRREISLELTVVFLNGEEVEYRPEYDDLNSAVANEFVGRFETEVKKKCTTNSTECQVKVTKLRKGSVIVSFTLIFTTPVTTNEGLAELIDAVNNGTIGPYSVRALKVIQQVEPTTTPSASPTGTTTTEKKTTPSSDGPPWVVIGAVIGGVVVFAIIVAVVTWCVHKKRECRRKDAKIHHSESEEQEAFSRQEGQLGAEDNAYSQVNHGYESTGPRSNGTETVPLQQRAATDGSDAAAHQQEAATSSTSAEVDKSTKKRKEEEEKLDYTHAEVDRSKETEKKPKSGEMIYADLEDINVPRAMSTVSTSPQPLPPVKRPEPYENTQYADITQFLKGDATLHQSDSNQGTELQPQGANKDEGGEDRNTPM